jgi:hypothetical protein
MVSLADRYLRTGEGTVPQIYPSTVRYLSAAMKDAQDASCCYPGEHFLEAVYEGERLVLQVYENGQCTYVTRRPS